MTWFFEGLPEGEKIPWGAWAIPLFWWLSFVAVLFFVLFCIVVILRKQWVEKERLIFPLAQVPLQMVEGAEKGSLIPLVAYPSLRLCNGFHPANTDYYVFCLPCLGYQTRCYQAGWGCVIQENPPVVLRAYVRTFPGSGDR